MSWASFAAAVDAPDGLRGCDLRLDLVLERGADGGEIDDVESSSVGLPSASAAVQHSGGAVGRDEISKSAPIAITSRDVNQAA